MLTTICLMLAVQFPGPSMDFAFMDAQENTVINWTADTRDARLRAIPVSVGNLLLRMGEPGDYRRRDAAKAELRAMGPGIARWLIWGQHLHNAEIRLRCRNLLREFAACPQCNGRGGDQDGGYWSWCRHCEAVGRFWPLESFIQPDPAQ